ncbi:D-galactonate transporter [Herbaspirillum seropedicae]|uniref:MFS transporter n=1 Tax=Herbaspirillum seropedicae TaxID=964 RepID=UPI003397A700
MSSVLTAVVARTEMDREMTMKKVALRIMPFVFLCYLVNFLDRTNIGYAALTMNQDLNIGPVMFGWIVGIFFVGYCGSEVPSNLAYHRFGARIWIARIMVTWGLITIFCAFVQSPTQLLVARFLLGVAEGGFSPGMFMYLSGWFPARWRAKAMAIFLIGSPISSVIGGPLSSAILSLHQVGGLKQWQWLFLLEGIPAIVLGVYCFFTLIDKPAKAAWLNEDERIWLTAELQQEQAKIEQHYRMTLFQTLTNSRVLMLALTYLAGLIGLNGVVYWMPQIVKSYGLTNVEVGLVTAIPNLCGAIAMLIWARRSDRTGKRIWHVITASLFGAAGMIVASLMQETTYIIMGLSFALIGAFAFLATFWALPPAFLTGRSAAAGFALILTVGNMSGFVGPLLVGWIKEATHSYSGSFLMLSTFLLGAALLTALFGRRTRLLEDMDKQTGKP